MKNYDQLDVCLNTARDLAKGKPIDNNTRLFYRGENIAVQLHATDIVIFYTNGDVMLDSGGWKTVTTKDRMNKYSPAQIWQEKGIWTFTYCGRRYLYGDKIILREGEVFLNGMNVPEYDPEMKIK